MVDQSLCGKEKLNSLHGNTIFLQKVLEDFPKECVNLEKRITKVAHQLEDIIESSISGPPFMYFRSIFSDLNWEQMYSAFEICSEGFESIVTEANGMTKSSKNEDMLSQSGNSSIGTSILSGGKIVGLDEDLNEILDQAVGHDPTLKIIPITGMGGIGKTTLARLVYEHPLIVDKFDICSWVTVSQEYNIQEILLEILMCKELNGEDVESLIVRLYQRLISRRFLIVLDDMWHGDVWDNVMRAFPDCGNGSRVIITTRLLEVVQRVNSSSVIHSMKLLSEDQSWFLIREKAYGCSRQLEDMGKMIASNCKGLPLAIVVVAELLKANMTQEYWEKIARNVIATAASSSDQLHKIISLSYDDLPHNMKACFLYVGVFPEDYHIGSTRLIQLWVSEGLINPETSQSMEQIAEEYLKDLVQRNILIAGTSDGTEWFCIHDILRDLCLRKAEAENFLQHYTGKCTDDQIKYSKNIKGNRRSIFYNYGPDDIPINDQTSPSRSILYFGELTPNSLRQFKLLRMVYSLKVRASDISSHDSILFKLVHLRYLAMILDDTGENPGDSIHISESIVKLQSLKILVINFYFYAGRVVLPWNIWKMSNLRHLVLPWNIWRRATKPRCLDLPSYQINGAHYGLQCLQTLSGVRNFKFTNDAIKSLPNLKTLGVYYDDEVHSYEDWVELCLLNNLVHLNLLEELNFTICYRKDISDHVPENKKPFPISLVLPCNLKKLTTRKTMSYVGSLMKLEMLKLWSKSFVTQNGSRWKMSFLGSNTLKWMIYT